MRIITIVPMLIVFMFGCSLHSVGEKRGRDVMLHDIPTTYSFIKYEENKLLFPGSRTDFDKFYGKLDTLLQEGKGRVNIVHIGGSHVQAGFFDQQIRNDFAGLSDSVMTQRGLFFPFSILHTNEPYGYHMTYSGEWCSTRCVKSSGMDSMGLAGAAVTTSDKQAKLGLRIIPSDSTRFSFNRLRILGYADSLSYPYAVVCGDTLRARREDTSFSYIIYYPVPCDSADVEFAISEGGHFTLEGIVPESDRAGVMYYAAGVNGADVAAWLRCAHLQANLNLICPDLAVFGIGINDANMPQKDFKPEVFKERYRKLIEKFKAANPDCALLFITNNDCVLNLAGKHGNKQFNPNTSRVATAFKELAKEYGGAVWDQYYIMGGARSSALWKAKGLMRKDRIHFTSEGYRLLGDLLYNAIMADYLKMNGN